MAGRKGRCPRILIGGEGRRHAKGVEDAFAHVVGEGAAGDLFDDGCQQDVVGVAVFVLLAGCSKTNVMGDQITDPEAQGVRPGPDGFSPGQTQGVREAAGVCQQVFYGDAIERPRRMADDPLEVGSDRLVEPKLALVDELEHRRRGEGLAPGPMRNGVSGVTGRPVWSAAPYPAMWTVLPPRTTATDKPGMARAAMRSETKASIRSDTRSGPLRWCSQRPPPRCCCQV